MPLHKKPEILYEIIHILKTITQLTKDGGRGYTALYQTTV